VFIFLVMLCYSLAGTLVYVDKPIIKVNNQNYHCETFDILSYIVSNEHYSKKAFDYASAYNIKLINDNCDYEKWGLACSIKNEHYYIRTKITTTKNESIFTITLYNPEGFPVESSHRAQKRTFEHVLKEEGKSSASSSASTFMGSQSSNERSSYKKYEILDIEALMSHTLINAAVKGLMTSHSEK
jgi:hypothetical protein